MYILFTILIVIVILIVIILLAAFLMKKEYTVEKEVTINKPKQEVFHYIKMIQNQAHYSKWVMMDPQSRKTSNGTDGTVGFFLPGTVTKKM